VQEVLILSFEKQDPILTLNLARAQRKQSIILTKLSFDSFSKASMARLYSARAGFEKALSP
jgi:hypothetical protein